MSLSRGCVIAELEPGKWYAFVAHREYDYNFESWNSYGPVASADAAWDEVGANEANPGGGNEITHDEMGEEMRNRYKRMLAERPPRNRMAPRW